MRTWLEKIRKAEGMTHENVASKCSISRQFYSMIENGNRCPSVRTAKAIAKLLGFDWTLFYEGAKSA